MNDVKEYYGQNAEREWTRLERHRTEFAVTQRVLTDYLPEPPAKVIDIGGGPGRYTLWLSQKGYEVTLVDLAPENLILASQKARLANSHITNILCSDARYLTISATAFDVVLLMGPLAHLLTFYDRQQAVGETMRVLKSNGILCASFLCRFAPFRHAAKTNPAWLLSNRDYNARLLRTGLHDAPQTFTYSYFSHPDEIIPFMQACGLETLTLVGCEGIVANTEETINELVEENWEAWVELNYQLAHEPSLLGAADHLLYVGRKK